MADRSFFHRRLAHDVSLFLNEPTINGATYSLPVLALTEEKGKNTSAWIGMRAADWPEGGARKGMKELEKIIYEFGVKFYRDEIRLQIDKSFTRFAGSRKTTAKTCKSKQRFKC